MKGLYIDVEDAERRCRHMDGLLGAPGAVASGETRSGKKVLVDYHPEDWPVGPIHRDPAAGALAAASGWFVFEGRLNDLPGLTDALLPAIQSGTVTEVLQRIEAGAFLVYLSTRDGDHLVTDPFGLHPHYVPTEDPLARAAPSPCFLADGLEPDPVFRSILAKHNHLFGDYTAYREIRRVPPGSLLSSRGVRSYVRYETETGDPEELLSSIRSLFSAFPGRKTVLPLSGGLDSRLILASHEFDYGFTMGPPRTGDRPVARRFAGRFREYREFSMFEPEYPQALADAGTAMFQGICAHPFLEILGVHRHVREQFGPGCLFVDGYLGDVLQRGTYLTSGGIYGSFARLWPFLTTRRFDPRRLLRRRYPSLSEDEFRLVYDVYRRTMADVDTDDLHKVLLFEILQGRGARYSVNGGTIMSGQYFTAVQPFFSLRVFGSLFPYPMEEKLSYAFLQRIWSRIPSEFSAVPAYSGYKPTWNPHLARATMLAVKWIARTGLYRRAVDYTSELPAVKWDKDGGP